MEAKNELGVHDWRRLRPTAIDTLHGILLLIILAMVNYLVDPLRLS